MSVKDYTDHLYFSGDYKKKLFENGTFTRDIPVLNLYENHYVFLYGSLKRGCSRSSLILSNKNSIFCGVGVTVDSNFDMLISSKGGFPVLIENTIKERLLKVKGEVWLLDTETLLTIDHLENNGHIYERELRRIVIGKENILAWVYIGLNSFWRDQVLIDSPKFPTNNAASVPLLERTNKHYIHYYNEAMAQKLVNSTENKEDVA